MADDFDLDKYRGKLYRRLDPLKPLSPDNLQYTALYEPLYEHHGANDPVRLVANHIHFSQPESLQLFSGFRGSGKTTELFRLRELLKAQGYVVLYADALKYLNPSEPIDITDLLVVLAGAFSDAMDEEGYGQLISENYWERFSHFLKRTNVNLDSLGIGTTKSGPIGGDIKLSLQSSPSFRQKLQEELSRNLGELKKDVDKFIESGVQKIKESRGDVEVVFLFDQLEQVRGSLFNEKEVIASVERLFAQHVQNLKLPYVHVVYTVPPWLKFVLPSSIRTTMLPSIAQWKNDEARSENPDGWQTLRSITHRRFGEEGFNRFFGCEGNAHPLADRVIGLCGGHFRDLFLLLREVVLRADTVPVTEAVVDQAIAEVRRNFLPIAVDDARWLAEIGRIRGTALPDLKADNVARLTRFLDTHFVLYFKNGEDWYDIHPLIREEVSEIVQRDEAARTATGAA